MKKFVVNGITLSYQKQISGIQRVCRELLLRLDTLLSEEPELEVEYLYADDAENAVVKLEEFKNIKPVAIHAGGKRKMLMQLREIPKYIKKNHAVAVGLTCDPLRSKGSIAFIHDLRPVVFKGTDSFLYRLKYKLFLHYVKKYAKKIVTVSDWQKERIDEYFKHKKSDALVTIYNGWEHISDLHSDLDVFKKYENLKAGEFYYSLGSIAPNKNVKWIFEVARRNPQSTFAVAGQLHIQDQGYELGAQPENLIMLGYVSDEENKALMQKCKAFLFPSLYEGFGIPPLEALACGAPIMISNATCLPEIYEDSARYFDPTDYEVDLDKLLQSPVESPEKILRKCSWDRAAEQLLALMKSY